MAFILNFTPIKQSPKLILRLPGRRQACLGQIWLPDQTIRAPPRAGEAGPGTGAGLGTGAEAATGAE